MTGRAFFRWTLFAAYVALFFVIPFYLVGDLIGLGVGISLWLGFLVFIRWNGVAKITRRLKVSPLTRAHHPALRAIVSEYCRRLKLPEPRVGVMASPAVNLGLFGFNPRDAHLVITQGAIERLSRDQLSSLIGRELCYFKLGESVTETWLCQFLWIFYRLINQPALSRTAPVRKTTTVKLFSKQILFFPLTLFPLLVLKGRRNAELVDNLSLKLTRKPGALSAGFRYLEAMQERIPFPVAFSDRHLFLLPPRNQDPLARVFFQSESFSERIRAIEGLRRAVMTN
jgi:heat shock protein HtpX